LQFINQLAAATSLQTGSSSVAFGQQSEGQPVDDSGVALRRLERVQRVIDRLESKNELTQKQERRLRNFKVREARILADINEQSDEIDHSLVDAAFSSL